MWRKVSLLEKKTGIFHYDVYHKQLRNIWIFLRASKHYACKIFSLNHDFEWYFNAKRRVYFWWNLLCLEIFHDRCIFLGGHRVGQRSGGCAMSSHERERGFLSLWCGSERRRRSRNDNREELWCSVRGTTKTVHLWQSVWPRYEASWCLQRCSQADCQLCPGGLQWWELLLKFSLNYNEQCEIHIHCTFEDLLILRFTVKCLCSRLYLPCQGALSSSKYIDMRTI